MHPHAHSHIHVTVPGDPEDPRVQTAPAGVVVHRVPDLHPDEVVALPSGLRVTSVARTLVDLADCMSVEELRAEKARQLGLLDLEAVEASAARVEWRPSLVSLNEVISEFSG